MDFTPLVRAHLPPLVVAREPEIIAELAEHLADLYEEARGRGRSHDEAVAEARAALPSYAADFARALEAAADPLPRRAAYRWQRSVDDPPPCPGRLPMLTDLRGDVRHALRGLVEAPGVSLGIILTLAIGIGANTVIFGAIDALLLRPAAVTDPDRLVRVFSGSVDGRTRFSTSSYPDYLELRDHARLAGLAAFGGIVLALEAGGDTVSLDGEVVSGNYFDVLGVPMLAGRGFLPHEDRAGTPVRSLVLSHRAWQRHFGGDPGIVGRTVTLNGASFTVVGVAAPRFTGVRLGEAADAWVPLALQPEVRPPSAGVRRALGSANLLEARGTTWLHLVGRLAPDATHDSATAALEVVSRRLQAAYPENRNRRFDVAALDEGPGLRTTARPLLALLAAVVALVLLIACANVASLLLVRAVARQREVAVRLAMGASRARLVRQGLAESLVLALLGGAGGVLLAWWALPVFHQFGVPESVELTLNVRVLLFTLGTAALSALVFGCAPVVHALRTDTASTLREEGRGLTGGRRAARVRNAFVVAQVALSVVLLVGAGLFLRTLQNAYAVDIGYPVAHTLLTDVNLDVRGYSPEAGQRLYAELLDRLRAIPGVASAAAARVTALSGGARTTRLSTDGQPLTRDSTNDLAVRTNVVSHGYLETMGIPLVSGRDFSSADRAGSPPVAIVSRSLATRLWPGANPVGRALVAPNTTFEVIGVVPDVTYAHPLEADAPPFFYTLLAQNYESGVTLHVRTAGDPLALAAAVRHAVRDIDSVLVPSPPRRLSDVLERTLGEQRMMARLVAVFGAVAALLALLGLYGVMAHQIAERHTEIGVRLALGAAPRSVLGLVMTQGLRLVLVGVALGTAAALAAAQAVRGLLFGVEPTDPATFGLVGLCFVLAAAAACLVPARRALDVDPSALLRSM